MGLVAYPPTAWFATFEVAIPAAIAGGLVGLVAGTIAQGVLARTGSITVQQSAGPGAERRWPDVVVVVGELVVLGALWALDWASRVDDLERVTYTDGPTSVLVSAALASLLLACMAVASRWQWPRWLLLATTLATAVTAVAVALSSIVAANLDSNSPKVIGPTATSYGLGAAVGVGAAFISAGVAFVGLLKPNDRTDLAAIAYQPTPNGLAPSRTRA